MSLLPTSCYFSHVCSLIYLFLCSCSLSSLLPHVTHVSSPQANLCSMKSCRLPVFYSPVSKSNYPFGLSHFLSPVPLLFPFLHNSMTSILRHPSLHQISLSLSSASSIFLPIFIPLYPYPPPYLISFSLSSSSSTYPLVLIFLLFHLLHFPTLSFHLCPHPPPPELFISVFHFLHLPHFLFIVLIHLSITAYPPCLPPPPLSHLFIPPKSSFTFIPLLLLPVIHLLHFPAHLFHQRPGSE